jgi:diacylglycerol kinase (ATP)
MKYLFILNPISGTKNRIEKIIDIIDSEMAPTGHQYDFACTTCAGEGRILATEGAEQRYDMIVAAGGDGTINEVAGGLIGSESSLGIIPLGSGNGIARSLGIPINLRRSIRHLLHPWNRLIDIGKINERFFVGICGMGFDASIGQKFQDFGIRGSLPYFLIGFREFLLYRAQTFILYLDGQQLEFKPLLVAIANTPQYGNRAVIAPQADPGDGLLDICILQPVSLRKAVSLTLSLFRGTIYRAAEYRHYRSREVRIISETAPCVIHTDGEPHLMPAELHIQVIERALKVCAGNIPGQSELAVLTDHRYE